MLIAAPLLRSFLTRCRALLLPLALLPAACHSGTETAETAAPPPVGHYEGSVKAGQLAENRAALDIRHPSPGHYEAELTVTGAANLNFVADTLYFARNELRLQRPGRPGHVLTLRLEGDFWRGTLRLDEVQAEALLVKRGPPAPSTYRVEELPQPQGPAWLYGPADTSTPGAALALLPDSSTAAAAPLWADALAREGLIVLVLPVADSTTGLAAAWRLLRHTPGADSASVGVWAAGERATALVQQLAAGQLAPAFVVAQNLPITPAARLALRSLRTHKAPLLGLYGGELAAEAPRFRTALGRRGAVLSYRNTAADLRVPGGFGPHFGSGVPEQVVDWLRQQQAGN